MSRAVDMYTDAADMRVDAGICAVDGSIICGRRAVRLSRPLLPLRAGVTAVAAGTGVTAGTVLFVTQRVTKRTVPAVTPVPAATGQRHQLPNRPRHKAAGTLAAALAAIVIVWLLAMPTVAFAEPTTTIVGLTNAGQQINGQKVAVKGEVVGDILNAEDGYKWLTLQDGGASIGVRVSAADAEKVTHLGRYNQRGTTVEVSGVFSLDCNQHDGLTDLHADTLVVLDPGQDLESQLNIHEIEVGALLVVVGLCLIVLHWRLRERTR